MDTIGLTTVAGVLLFCAIVALAAPGSRFAHNRRGNRRFGLANPLEVIWLGPDGATHTATARGVDISDDGFCIDSRYPIAPGAFVYVEDHVNNLCGRASVRSCVPKGLLRYRIGLQLRGVLLPRP